MDFTLGLEAVLLLNSQLTRNVLATLENHVLIGGYVTLWRRYSSFEINYFHVSQINRLYTKLA